MLDTNTPLADTLLIPKLTPKGDNTVLTFVELPLPNRKVRQGRCSMKHLHEAGAQQDDSFDAPVALHESGGRSAFTHNIVDASYSISTDLLSDCVAITYNGMTYDIHRKEVQ